MVWYHLFYEIEDGELERAQSFEDEWKLKSQGRINPNQLVRAATIVAITSLFSNSAKLSHWSNLFLYLTNLSAWTVLLTAMLGFIIAQRPRLTQKKAVNLHALHHLFYSLALFTQPVVMIVYWTIIHEKNLMECKSLANGDQEWYEAMVVQSCLIHLIPGICISCLLYINQTVLIRRHSYLLIVFGLFYGISNYFAVKKRGKPLYWFLTWEDYRSPLIMMTIIGVFTGIFYMTTIFDEFLTGRSASKRKLVKI